ncbi:choice-of-anchor L domain-containing protein [Luteolibacter marinus]|uniref:choice-of-anchor L domain-containing protein n=1 Tax=Luteolibacter marinus TaxID=2776705 RepID=UPI001865DC5C
MTIPSPPDNHAAANAGQAKWMALRAFQTLSDRLGSTADVVEAIESELFKDTESATSGVFFPERPLSPSADWLAAQKSPLQTGALKALAAPFYKHLSVYDADWVEDQLLDNELVADESYFTDTDNTLYPWNPANDSNASINRGMANVGQLKLVFSLDFSTLGPAGPAFVTLPIDDSTVLLEEGVVCAFDIDSLGLPTTTVPERIDIHVRPDGVGAPWTQIGKVTSISYREMIDRTEKFVRGSTVWIPESAGVYEIKAEAFGSGSSLLSSETRTVTVVGNHAPTVTITDGPDSPATSVQDATFEVTVSDPDLALGDSISYVEFYDNGVLFATDYEAPFGVFDGVDEVPETLWAGTHSITAKAYDAKGATSALSSPYTVIITDTLFRPELEITSPANGSTIAANTNLTISVDATNPNSTTNITVTAFIVETGELESEAGSSVDEIVIPHAKLQDGENTIVLTVEDGNEISSYKTSLKINRAPNMGATLAAVIADESSVTITNSIYKGPKPASDEFSDGLDFGLEIDSGVLLTSGLFEHWDDGNISPATSKIWDEQNGGDADLEARISGNYTRDPAILEFDAECDNGQLELEIQFGSEEYLEYVGSFNDAFAVFVDGVVVSLVPDGEDIIALNSIHSETSSEIAAVRDELYYDEAQILDRVVSPHAPVEYDGMTLKLKLHAFVTPEEIHHVKIVIADVNDGQLDSGLFMETASLRTIDPAD